MRTANPVLNAKALQQYRSQVGSETVMTVDGTVNKTIILFLLLMAGAAFSWKQVVTGTTTGMMTSLTGLGAMVGIITALIIYFVPKWVSTLAPIYAIAKGLFLGGLSAILEMSYPGIVMQAVALTFGTLAALLVAYKSGMIKVTDKFRAGIVAATGGIFLVYLASLILSFFGVILPFFRGGSFGIGFTLFVAVIAALNLVLDFDFIEQASDRGAPKYMEWYGAFGLMVTLIWLYIEILRLLQMIRGRD